jgi:hypothetical protein
MTEDLGEYTCGADWIGMWGVLGDSDKDRDDTDSTYILVRNDFDILDMTGCLKNLTEDIFGDSWVQTANVQCALVWLRGCTSCEASLAIWRHHAPILAHWRGDRGRDRVGILWDDDRWESWRWHVLAILAILIAWRSGR